MTSSHLSVVASLLIAGSAWAAEPAAVEGIAPLHPSAPVQTVGQELDFTLGMDGLAQDEDEDEDMDFGEEEEESSVAEERRAVESGRVDSEPGATDSDLEGIDESRRTKRTIKVLQKKNFLKIGRGEGNIHAGFLSNDPFINRYLVGIGLGYHVTEIFSVHGDFTFSPDLGRGDWKPITKQLVDNNQVSPDISKMIWVFNATTQFSPIYGKIAVLGGKIIVFDIYGIFGFGVAGTQDDLEAIQCDNREGEPCTATASQVHPTTTIGGGFRVAFSKRVAARFEARSLSYIETLDGTSLEMKNNLLLQVMGTYFFDIRRN